MLRLQRFLYYFLLIAFFTFIAISFLPQLNNTQKAILKQKSPPTPPPPSPQQPKKKLQDGQEKYLSWFPHSGFPEQQESFRNGLRLAIETNRTIIAPMLRLNSSYTWMPFEQLAKSYEAQDKALLRKACEGKEESLHWRTILQPCESINEWAEIPWSSIMDLEILKKEYGVRIIERQGHSWGVEESALDHVDPDDVTVVDVMSFEENGTNWEHADASNDIQKQAQFNPIKWIQALFESKKKDTVLVEPLKNVFSIEQLHAIDTRIIQFGALNSAARYQTTPTPLQQELRKAMMKTRFVTPDRLKRLTDQSSRIVDKLGGKYQYSTLILNLTKLVEMDARASELVPEEEDQLTITTGSSSIEQLSEKARLELMDAVVLEIFGDIPINQAISAALPIKDSKLATLLERSLYDADRHELLEACIDYHKNIESRYPIYYITNDMGLAPETRPDIFNPLLKMFPCVFSSSDMYQWGILTDHWSMGQPELSDPAVNYEKLLQPLMDILIAQKGYSFFEIPTTPLTRFLNWGPKN